jgi:hypothetical protein
MNLAGGLKTETVRYRLPVAREVKTEIPVKGNSLGIRLPIPNIPRRESSTGRLEFDRIDIRLIKAH